MMKFIRLFSVISLLLSLTGSAVLAEEMRIQDNLYRAVNQEWIDQAELTPFYPVVDNSTEIDDELSLTLHTDLFEMIIGEREIPSAALEQFVQFYYIASNFERREADGAEPLKPYLEKIAQIQSLSDLQKNAAEFQLLGIPLPFQVGLTEDLEDSTRYTVFLSEPSLFTYSADESDRIAENKLLKEIYTQSKVALLEEVGYSHEEATNLIEQALLFESVIRPYLLTVEQESDYATNYFPKQTDELTAYSKNIQFDRIVNELFEQEVSQVVLSNEKYFEMFDFFVLPERLEALKAWMTVGFIQSNADYLTDEMRLLNEQYENALLGITESLQQEDAAYSLAFEYFEEPIGIYYGQTYFGQEAKQDVENMAQTIIEAYKERLRHNDWLTQSTIEAAIHKLDALEVYIGYPTYQPYVYTSDMFDLEDSLFNTMMRLQRFYQEMSYASLDEPVDKTAWVASGHEINAFYSPTQNAIYFPAGYLNAPNYSLDQSVSEKYGGLGATIGHEITHAFDPQGAKFDAFGNKKDWWTPEDFDHYQGLAQRMVLQWDMLTYAGERIDGSLTLAENVADAGGLAVAIDALQKQAGDDADMQVFFESWAKSWRQKLTPEYERELIRWDTHAPNELRTNVTVQNNDLFHEVFGVKKGDGMYLAPEERSTIW
ncbi:MAG: M13 family metallopeptidase [Aerococcaceae bacterium]|nr:M13 family metallopeptidase [Aerococcaceae bacterium]